VGENELTGCVDLPDIRRDRNRLAMCFRFDTGGAVLGFKYALSSVQPGGCSDVGDGSGVGRRSEGFFLEKLG